MISVVVPIFNECENIAELHSRLFNVMKANKESFEIIFIDDGSTDGTFDEIKNLKCVRAYSLTKNVGKSLALIYGIKQAKGEIIITLDGDLENHPEDIPKLLQKINEGYDVVKGWRKERWKDSFITRKIPSLLANWVISKITKVKIHDNGCCLTAYKAKLFDDSVNFGDFDRMVVPYLAVNDINICEVPVSFTPRKYGKSKYGISRTFKVILDLTSYSFFKSYSDRPMHFFGYFGFIFNLVGILLFLIAIYLKFFKGINFNKTPLPELIAIFTVVGFQSVLMGLLGEITVRKSGLNVSPSISIKEEHIAK